jgi:nicotinate-nucleotide adenylyltransferase
MKIALFFGSFNPFHNGHHRLGEYVLEHAAFDAVWYVVSPCNPLKNQTDLLDENIRLEMLVGAIQNNPALKACDIEFDMPIPSYTIDTLQLLTTRYPENEFTLMIGSDNALVFDQWKDYEKLLQTYLILVYPRPGYDFEQVRERYPAMQLIDSPEFNISSTEIRKHVKLQKDISAWVHPFVLAFIRENQFYL